MYKRAAQVFATRGWNRRDTAVRPFPKREAVTKGPPRLINPRSAVYNVALGTYLAPIEKLVYKRLTAACTALGAVGPVVAKGMNAETLAAVMRGKTEPFASPAFVGLDASRFDQHISRQALEFEHSILLDYYPGDAELAALLRAQLRNEGTGYTRDGKCGYSVDGVRMSGDFNTSLGNCTLMVLMVLQCLIDCGITHADLINNGDDVVVILERADEARFVPEVQPFFGKLGFDMAVEPTVYDLRQAEFCQMRYMRVNDRETMVRNPVRAVAKDTVFLHNMRSERVARTIINAKGVAGMSLYGDVPVLSALYSSMAAVEPHIRPVARERQYGGLEYWARGAKLKQRTITAAARVEFWECFGITPDHQELLEHILSRPFPLQARPTFSQTAHSNPAITETSPYALLLKPYR
jgi:hypothetical protein